jgi:HEAT repeat protein
MTGPDHHVLKADQDEELRYHQVQEQRHVPLTASRDILFHALGDESWRVRKQAVEVLLSSHPADTYLHQLIELLRDEDNAGLRNATAEVLIGLGRRTVPVLLAHLDDSDHDLRKLVVDTLGALGGSQAVQGLTRALSDPDLNVASAAAEGLGACGDATSVKVLLSHLEKNHDQFFRFNVLAALGKIGVAGPLPPVICQLAGQDMLRRAVYECLGKIGGDLEAFDLLLEGTLSHLPSIRQAAICSLAQVLRQLDPAEEEVVKARLQRAVEQGLLDYLTASFCPGKLAMNDAVVAILEKLADLRGARILIRALADERLATGAERALQAIGKESVQIAVACFDETDAAAERAAICLFLGHQGNAQAVSVMRSGLCDKSAQVRAAAVQASVRLADPTLPGLVAGLLTDEDASVRTAALSALRHYADTDYNLINHTAEQMASALEPEQRRGATLLFAALHDGERLSRLLKDEDATVREAAARAVGTMQPTDGCSHLMIALVDEEPDVRIAAAEALGDCNNSAAIQPLRLLLNDSDSWVQAAALRSLVQLAGEDALPDTLDLWEHGDEVVQLACLEVLSMIGLAEGMQVVSRDLCRHDGEVLKGAIELLSHFDSTLLRPWFQHLLCHSDWDVRITAVRASGALPAEERTMFLSMALEHEENDLVKSEIQTFLGNS